MVNDFRTSDPLARKRLLVMYANGDLAPGELLGPLLDSYDEPRLEHELAQDDDAVRQQVREFVASYHPPRVPCANFGRIDPKDAERWQRERDRKYAVILRALGIAD